MRSKRCDSAKSKSIYSISHRLLLGVESSKNKKKYIYIMSIQTFYKKNCRKCKNEFAFNNTFHNYLKKCTTKKRDVTNAIKKISSSRQKFKR